MGIIVVERLIFFFPFFMRVFLLLQMHSLSSRPLSTHPSVHRSGICVGALLLPGCRSCVIIKNNRKNNENNLL